MALKKQHLPAAQQTNDLTENWQMLQDLQLLSPQRDALYDHLTQLATQILQAPVSLLSILTAEYQFFKSEQGMASRRKTPLSHSFCQYVVRSNQPMIVSDARRNALLKDNPAINELGVVSYLGFPIETLEGQQLGAFCVIDHQARHWTIVEIAIVKVIAQLFVKELRSRIVQGEAAHADELNATRARIETRLTALDLTQSQENILQQLIEIDAQSL